MDAADRNELVRISDHKFEVAAGRRRRSRICADDVVFNLGRIAGRSLCETFHPRHDADRADDLRILTCSWSVGGLRHSVIHYRHRGAEWRRDGLRHARASGIHCGNDKPRRFAKCDLAQQLHREWGARCRSISCRSADWRSRCYHLFFSERCDLCRRDRGFVDDAIAALRAARARGLLGASMPGTASFIQ